MTFISMSMPFEGRLFIEILNLAVCAVLFNIRIYHWRMQEIKDYKLSATGLSSILFALLYCSQIVTLEIRSYTGHSSWCYMSVKLISVTYVLHRVLIYLFLILRLEIVSQGRRQRIVWTGKVVIVVSGIFMVAATMVYTEGFKDQDLTCRFKSKKAFLAIILMMDIFICVSGTWMFIHPLRLTVRNIEDWELRCMLRKTQKWSIVCLVSTLLVLFTLVVIEGGVVFVAFDCSITSFALVMMMSPATRDVTPESDVSFSHMTIGELQQITGTDQEKPFGFKTSGLKLSSSRVMLSSEFFLDMQFQTTSSCIYS